uniref:SSD domain-containing protein n=1 Tax=Meloidogyne floridensis TaxID=298350 RepID=A0A915PAD9_9BILA
MANNNQEINNDIPPPPNLNDENGSSIGRSISSTGSSGFAEESISGDNQRGREEDEGEVEEEERERERAASVADKSVLRIGIGLFGVQSGVELASSPVDRLLARIFRYLGGWIAQKRHLLVISLLILTFICSSSIPFTPQQDDLKSGYTPLGARSREELARYEQFFRPELGKTLIAEEPITLLVFIIARDNGSLLRDSLMEQTVQLLDTLANDFPLGGRPFNQFCTHFCQMNEPIRQFSNGLSVRKRHLEALKDGGGEIKDGIYLNLSFPFMSLFGHQVDLSPHFFGAEIDKNEGELKYLRLALLQFKADKPENVNSFDVLSWERKIVNYLHNEYKGDLRPLVFSMGFVADEVVRTGMTLFPFLSVGFVIMCGFSIGTVALSGLHFRQFSHQKVIMAIIACCCPLFACATALGLLFWFGVRFGTILCVSPFLVLAIGVDDAFLMLQSWQRICSLAEQLNEEEKEENNNLIELEEKLEKLICKRLGQMLEDVGPSVTITSATNFLAFCVGIFTPTPEIQLFCAGNASAIFVDYIYQLFLFTPFLAISAKWEMKEKAKKRCRHTLPVQRRFFLKISQKLAQFLRAYCRWISSGFTATLVATTLLIFWGLSAKWASKAIPNITPRKLFLADSPLNEARKKNFFTN